MTIVPLRDMMLVKVKGAQERSKGGLFLPESAKEEKSEGRIIACGPKVKEVKVGDEILFGKYGGDDIEIEDEKYKMIKEVEVFAILKEDK